VALSLNTIAENSRLYSPATSACVDRFGNATYLLISLLVCAVIASAHNLRFGLGFGGFIFGNIASAIVIASMMVTIWWVAYRPRQPGSD
jgi:hypothetical protein